MAEVFQEGPGSGQRHWLYTWRSRAVNVAQLIKRWAIPFPLNADSLEDEILGPAKRRAAMWDQL